MSFTIQGLGADHFEPLNDYFLNGFDKNELTERTARIQHPNAIVHFYEWYFQNIRISYSDWQYERPTSLAWNTAADIELVTCQVNLQGSLFMEGASDPFMSNFQHNLFYSPPGTADSGMLKSDGLKSSMFFLQFTKEAFLRLTHNGNEILDQFNKNIIDNKPAMLCARNLPADPGLLSIINNIVHCNYSGGIKKLFLLSKALELLVLQAEKANSLSEPAYHHIKSAYDMERIRYVREYVMGRLDNPPGLHELARVAGINEYKLKRGFKEMFGTTVFGYIADARLMLAKNELSQNQKKIGEIADSLGYSSVQHFSAAFKKKFGVSPGKFEPGK